MFYIIVPGFFMFSFLLKEYFNSHEYINLLLLILGQINIEKK